MEGSAFPWLAPSPSRPQANPSGGRWRKREPTRDLPPQALQSSRNLSEFVQRPSSRALVGSGFAKIKIRHPGKPAGKPGSPLIRPSAFFGGQGRIAQAIAPLIKNLAGGQGRGPFNPAAPKQNALPGSSGKRIWVCPPELPATVQEKDAFAIRASTRSKIFK